MCALVKLCYKLANGFSDGRFVLIKLVRLKYFVLLKYVNEVKKIFKNIQRISDFKSMEIHKLEHSVSICSLINVK